MAVELATAYISLVPSFRGGEAAIAREASRMGQQAGGQMANSMGSTITQSTGRGGALGRSFGSISNGMKAFAGIAAVGFAADAIAGFVAEAEEAAKVTRATEAVIKSTGGVARVSADDINALAESLSAKSGIDDEVIASGQNVLLTFTNIRNEVGEGNNVFDQASEAALNMSAALGQDLQGSITLVGKALNDPIKGMSALTRAGVQFTEEQKATIATLVETGDTLGAQKIILGELSTQFGGAAEANATATGKMGVAWGNIQEQLGTALLPLIEKFADLIGRHLPTVMALLEPIISGIAFVLQIAVKSWEIQIKYAQLVFQGLVAVVQTVAGAVVAAVQWLVDAALAVWDGLQPLVSFFETFIVGPLIGAVQGLADVFGTIIGGIVTGALAIWDGLSAIVSFFSDFVVGPVIGAAQSFSGAVGLVIGGLVSGVTTVWNGLGAMVSFINDNVIGPISSAVSGFATGIKLAIGALVGVVRTTWEGLGAIVSWFNDHIVAPVVRAVLGFKDGIVGTFSAIVDGVRTVWGFLANVVKAPINLVIGFYTHGIKRVWDATIGAIGLPKLPDIGFLNSGGFVSGPDVNKDVVPAMLTPGEFVINRQSAQRLGPGLLEWLNDGGMRGTADPGIFGFATGGPVKSLQDTLAFAHAQVGKPYQWPSLGPTTGPNSYDCSGFTSAVLNFALGLSPYSRRHSSTSQVNDPALAPGLGPQNGLSFGNRAAFMLNKTGQRVGHTALTLGGTNFEATPPRVRSGPGAKGATSFPRIMHLPRFGGPSEEQIAIATGIRDLGSAGAPDGGGGWGQITQIGAYIAQKVAGFLREQIIKIFLPWWEGVADFFSRGIQPSDAFGRGGEVRRNGPILVGEYGPEIRYGSRGQYIQAMDAGAGGVHLHVHGDIVGDAAWKRHVAKTLDDGFRARRREAVAGSRHP